MFGLEIATLLLGISFIAAGMIQSRTDGGPRHRQGAGEAGYYPGGDPRHRYRRRLPG